MIVFARSLPTIFSKQIFPSRSPYQELEVRSDSRFQIPDSTQPVLRHAAAETTRPMLRVRARAEAAVQHSNLALRTGLVYLILATRYFPDDAVSL